MIRVQLDECSDSPELAKLCGNSGVCSVRRYPKKERKTKNPQMLQKYMLEERTLVTFDRHIIEEHSSHIPNDNPGIVILLNSPQDLNTFTLDYAKKILKNFKLNCVDWHLLSWSNSFVKITEISVEAGYVRDGIPTLNITKLFSEKDWLDEFKATLNKNSKHRSDC